MSELIAIVYPSEQDARAAMATLERLRSTHVIEIEDACYVTRDAAGDLELHQRTSTVRRGAVAGAFLGALVGTFLANPGLGAAAGAGLGALAGRTTDFGIPDELMRALSGELQLGRSALFVLLAEAPPDVLGDELAKHGGRILHSTLPYEANRRLRDSIDRAVIADACGSAGKPRGAAAPPQENGES